MPLIKYGILKFFWVQKILTKKAANLRQPQKEIKKD